MLMGDEGQKMTDYVSDVLVNGSANAEPITRSGRVFRSAATYDALAASESSMVRKFMGTRSAPKPLVYEFTDDVALRQQYYQMRENMFINVWGLKSFFGGEDKFDSISQILVARQGNLCIGGLRLTISTPQNTVSLPLETEDFQLCDLVPELELHDKTYAELSRYAVLPDFQGPEIYFEGSRRLFARALAQGVEYAFAISPLGQARNYRRTATALGLGCEIRKNIEVPDRDNYEGIKMYLSIFDFRPLFGVREKARHSGQEVVLDASI
uniref:Long chain N-acyltryptophan synthase n=1 Tax=uncultured bacterium CSL1 TaxID=1091565 RepID=Q6XQL6_9BACT|nr:long chain N-acyltryptophan synthase [uncultured bacterium CSL1]